MPGKQRGDGRLAPSRDHNAQLEGCRRLWLDPTLPRLALRTAEAAARTRPRGDRMTPKSKGIALAVALAFAAGAHAQAPQNIEKLKQMKVATTDLNIPVVPQTGKNADAIRENLKRVKLPPGFKIELFAIVPDARHMAVAPSTNMLFVGTRKTTVWAVTDRNSDGVADEVKSVRAEPEVHGAQRRVLDQGRLPDRRRAQPRAQLPGRRVLLRRPGRRGDRGRAAGQAGPARGGELQPRRAHLPRRRRRQALHHARPAVQRAAAGQGRDVREARHRRHDPA